MKRTILAFIILIITSPKAFCLGLGENPANNYYAYLNGKATEIIVDKYTSDSDDNIRKDSYELNYTYLQNGLVIIQVEGNNNWKTRYICYNEYYNENIESDIKLNEMIELDYQFPNSLGSFEDDPINIAYNGNEVEVVTMHRTATFVETRQILSFDRTTKRLKSIQVTNTDSNGIILGKRNREYKYDDNGRLTNISYEYDDWGDILNTAYYYDGIQRFSPKTWYSGPNIPSPREIVIYDGNILRYRIVTKAEPGSYTIFNGSVYYVQFEHDKHANEIRQEAHHKDDTVTVIETELIELDDRQNWTHIRRYKDGKLIVEFYRKIKYAQ
jgi:hypothetical protein